jgi:homoserine O-acetyltransferase
MRVPSLVGFCLMLSVTAAAAQSLIVEKKTFELPSYVTEGGKTIAPVKIGWESYGTLNAEKSNAILIAHYFSGTSHAAGKYAESDAAPGYWDYLIGPGKAIDTNKYFVISSDTLVNLSPGDPHVVTTGPASTDPSTGKPYGMRFPLVTMRDFVNVQKALVDSLGIKKLHAVMGASMGGLQTYVWASAYPDMMTRIVPVISAGAADPWLIAWVGLWGAPITADSNWNNGDYYGRTPPTAGLKLALKLVTLQANHWLWAEKTFGRAPAVEGKDPREAFADPYKIEAYLEQAAEARAKVADANHLLYLVKANQTFAAGPTGTLDDMKRIKAKTLILYSPTDQVFAADWVKATAAAIQAAGTPVETAEIAGPYGHLNGVLALTPLAPKIARFLDE